MVSLSITSNAKAFVLGLKKRKKQLRFAQALALTRTAGKAKDDFERTLESVLDRPTPFTKRSVGTVKATKDHLVSTVFIKRIQAEYLKIQETGGTRRPKGRAFALAAGQRLNRYGNIPRGAIAKALARPNTFSATIGGVGGIWKRNKRGKLKLLFIYTSSASYRPRLRFRRSIERSVRRHYKREYQRAHDFAMRTAK